MLFVGKCIYTYVYGRDTHGWLFLEWQFCNGYGVCVYVYSYDLQCVCSEAPGFVRYEICE